MSRRRLISIACTAAGVAILSTAWILFAPTQLGGRTAYTMVVGTSMEPRLHRGDLVLVRRADDYRVGDVVAYHSRALGRDVLHRIVARRGDGYVLKGDANDFVDPGPIRGADLIGRYSLRIGGGASVLQWLRTPAHAALVTGLVALLLLGTGAGAVERRRRGARARRPATPAWIRSWTTAQWDAVAAWSAIALLAFAALGIVVFSRPNARSVPVAEVFSHHGRFAYGASAPRGPAYPDGRVRSGDAVFTQLVHALRVGFDWRLGTALPHAVHGTVALDAVVSDGAGWERRLTLARPRPFRGDSVSVGGILRLDGIRTLLGRFQAETGATAGAYAVRLEPRVAVAGVVDGSSVEDVFAPTLPLTLDQQRLRVAAPSETQSGALVRSRSVGGTVQAPNDLSVVGLGVPPTAARLLAVLGALASLVVLAAALARRRETGPDESVSIPHGVRTVRVLDEPPAERTVEVASPDELVRIAERYDRLVLECEPTATFLVQDDGVTYRWRGRDGRGASGPAERRDHSTRPWAGAGEADLPPVERRAAQEP